MKIQFTLNNKEIEVDVPPEKRLVNILREDLNCLSVKKSCLRGQCGICSVIMDNNLVYSCLIPAFFVAGSQIMTLEGLMETKEYSALSKGFEDASCRLCHSCIGSRYLAAFILLERSTRPSLEEIKQETNGIHCQCIDKNSLYRAIQTASRKRERKFRVRKV